MKQKTKVLVDRFVKILSAWDGVECIVLNEAALPDTLDPYFALILDVFHSGKIPESEDRFSFYGEDAAVFETSKHGNKDRFLVGDIPVRIEYKATSRIEALVRIADTDLDNLWLVKDSGTYGYYRLAHGDILYSKSDWIDKLRDKLKRLDERFWIEVRDAYQSKMEHFLSDLGAAVIQNDAFHYLIASAGFIKHACLVLFCVNRRFEPSHRAYYSQVRKLAILPPSFNSQFDSFLSTDGEMTMERRYSLAQIIARSVIAL